jgi:hypothetical protein
MPRMPRGFFSGLFDRGAAPHPHVKPVAIPVRPVATPVKPVAIPVTKPVAIPVRPRAIPQPIFTGRKIDEARRNKAWYRGEKPPYGTSEGAEQVLPRGSAYEDAFLNGTLNYVTSSVIQSGQYDREAEELTLTFRPETTLRTTVYEDITEDEAVGFFVAGSKGKWWHQVCLGPSWTPGGGTAKNWHFA